MSGTIKKQLGKESLMSAASMKKTVHEAIRMMAF